MCIGLEVYLWKVNKLRQPNGSQLGGRLKSGRVVTTPIVTVDDRHRITVRLLVYPTTYTSLLYTI